MSLGRMEIRHAVRDRLLSKTAAQERVYTTRVRAHWKGKLPALAVYTTEEGAAEILAQGQAPVWRRPLTVAVDVVVDEKDGTPDDQVDLICHQVEAAIFLGPPFLGLERVLDLRHAGVQFRFDGRGERLLGAARVLLELPYQYEIDPDPTTMAPWLRVATDWDLPAPDGLAEAVDLQELDQ